MLVLLLNMFIIYFFLHLNEKSFIKLGTINPIYYSNIASFTDKYAIFVTSYKVSLYANEEFYLIIVFQMKRSELN